MATPTNFYKNPSTAYNKQFNLNSVLQNLQSYNIATGNAPSDRPATIVQRKRRRESRPQPPVQRNEVEEDDGPMSHQEYILKRRKEADSSQPYQELNEDVLECSSSGFKLVGYESDSDRSTSAECEEDRGRPRNSDDQLSSCSGMQYFPISASIEEEADRIKSQSEQRYPAPGEPVCVVCGKYGEYICNETNEDICSTECKAQVLQSIEFQQEPQGGEISVGPIPILKVPESGGDTWDYDRHCWSKKISGLCTYECWKCQKPGHLAEDCSVTTSSCESSAAGKTYNNVSVDQNKSNTISRGLLDLYRRCHQIGKNFLTAKCSSCRGSTSLGTCISCNNTYCDCAGHLSEHIRGHPSHQQYYSYKLKRLVKCCKSTCKVTEIKDLLTCHYCFNKAFDKFYDMYTATWKPSGLSIIWNSICCEDHFEWHRLNCSNANVEDDASILKNKHVRDQNCVQLSDFIF